MVAPRRSRSEHHQGTLWRERWNHPKKRRCANKLSERGMGVNWGASGVAAPTNNVKLQQSFSKTKNRRLPLKHLEIRPWCFRLVVAICDLAKRFGSHFHETSCLCTGEAQTISELSQPSAKVSPYLCWSPTSTKQACGQSKQKPSKAQGTPKNTLNAKTIWASVIDLADNVCTWNWHCMSGQMNCWKTCASGSRV